MRSIRGGVELMTKHVKTCPMKNLLTLGGVDQREA
jgi:hypothetical protein